MGNTPSEEVTPEPATQTTAPSTQNTNNSYVWPANLYEETCDMAAASFLVYSFAYVLDTARKFGLQGLKIDSEGHATKSTAPTSRLERSFTPKEVQQLIEDNLEILAEKFPSVFADPTIVKLSLQRLQERASISHKERPIALVEFDDKHQDRELVYAVAKDDISKRITLCFRGTDNHLAKDTNWSSNMDFWKASAPVPEAIKENVSTDQIWFHGGFYNYIFAATATETDPEHKSKYDEIVEDVKPLLEANPGYKLYVTGHSLGGALASIVAFYLACDDSIPKPVTCLNFASPRVGDHSYLEASTALEASKKFRFLRIINDKDPIALSPMFNFYHAGYQIRLYSDPVYEPEVTYPKIVDTWYNRWTRTWNNSLFMAINLAYDHGEYPERIDRNKEALEKLDLNKLYNDPEMTGFSSDS